MRHGWRVAGLLLGAACASGGPASRPGGPAPAPPATPRPSVDPVRTTPAPPVALRYPRSGGGIVRYAFHRRDSLTATMPSGETQVQQLARTAYLTLTLVHADSGSRITAVVDSVRPDSGFAFAALLLDSARAARWTAWRDTAGHTRVDAGTSPSLAASQIRDELQLLFPPLPPQGALPGARWTDSTTMDGRVSAFAATEVVHSQLAAGTALSVAGAVPVEVLRSRAASGTGTQFGQPISVAGTGADSLAYQLFPDGRVVQVEGRRWTDLVVSLPTIGQSVPARESSTLLFTLLR